MGSGHQGSVPPSFHPTISQADAPTADTLYLRLHGGMYVQKAQHAVLRMRCDNAAEEPTAPTYRWTWNGTYWFDWRTRHACALNAGVTQPDTGAPNGGADGEHPPSDDFTSPSPAASRVWKGVVWTFAACVLRRPAPHPPI
jgi:hypothetical protein